MIVKNLVGKWGKKYIKKGSAALAAREGVKRIGENEWGRRSGGGQCRSQGVQRTACVGVGFEAC